MILTQSFRARRPSKILEELNRESGRVYTLTMIEHWRVRRKKDIWLSKYAAQRVNDALSGSTILHAHSRDAAQDGFYKACKTVKALKRAGVDSKYPHRRKTFRSTVWKKQGIRVKDGKLLLAKSRGLEPVVVSLPERFPGCDFLEVKLVFNRGSKRYDWHVTYDDGQVIPKASGDAVIAVDLGEIHPAAVTDGTDAVVFSARELRSTIQGRNKMLSVISERQATLKKGSRYWRRLQRVKAARLNKSKDKQRDICHKVSRAVVDFAQEKKAGTIVIGDVRDVSNGVSLGKNSNQKISQWPHGIIRKYIEYKASGKGINTELQNEAYSSQDCPKCGNRKKPQGRIYTCGKCGWIGSRDGQVGSANILSLHQYGKTSRVLVSETMYRHPYLVIRDKGKRSHEGTVQVACGLQELQEAVGFNHE